jgi:hypothetical protein
MSPNKRLMWQKVIPMLRCWEIFVSLKEMDGFESALANLERTVMILEAICHHQ